jgi:protein-disulfide isomerase
VLVAILLATSAGAAGRKDGTRPIAEVKSLLRGIPEQRERLGNPNAPITLWLFGDLECPACDYFVLRTLPTLIREFVRPGKLKIEYHSFKSYTAEASVFEEQQVAALAAGQQNKLWYFVELFYHEQNRLDQEGVNERTLRGVAKQVPGLNIAEWIAARGEESLATQVTDDAERAAGYGWESTPDFLLTHGGLLLPFRPAGPEARDFADAIKESLRDLNLPA